MITYREHCHFIGEVGELLVIKVILKIYINRSHFFQYITLLVPADQLQCKTTPYKVSAVQLM